MVSKTASNVVPIDPKKPATMGSLIDKMITIRDQRRVLAEQDKKLVAEFEALGVSLLEVFDKQGTTKGESKKGSASVSISIVPNVTDWDVFFGYIIKNKYTHLLQRRAATEACRELFEKKGSIPGVEPFSKRTINLRNI